MELEDDCKCEVDIDELSALDIDKFDRDKLSAVGSVEC